MRPFFFQNGSSGSPEEVIINFTNTRLGFKLMYLAGSTYKEAKPQHLKTCKSLKVNYAYLGGEHFCNYEIDRRILGDNVMISFQLNKAPIGDNDEAWDIDNAVFSLWPVAGQSTTGWLGLSPIRSFMMILDENGLNITSVQSFQSEANAQGNNYPVIWDTVNNTLTYRNPDPINLTFNILKSQLIQEAPVLLDWYGMAENPFYPLAYTYSKNASNEQSIEMIVSSNKAWDMNNDSTRTRICHMENDGTISGPSVLSTSYKNFIEE